MPATYAKWANGAQKQEQQQQSEQNNNDNSISGTIASGQLDSKSALTSGLSSRQQPIEEKRADLIHSTTGGGFDSGSLISCTNSDGETRSLNNNNNSNADYDQIRNATLMFFLDRLFIASKESKGLRTLHDLSCLFGKREFTKEMRQIVGASRNGLRKFLQSYPSLFTIDGDKVYLTELKQDPTNPAVRDYNREAINYFTKKLEQFGTSLVPIRNLFGYRSQASQEVRHVSGKSIKEFKEFLSSNSDVFEILADEHVVLKSVIEEFESRGESYSLAQMQQTLLGEEVVMDPYLNKQFAHYIEDVMKKMNETLLEGEKGEGDEDDQVAKGNQDDDNGTKKQLTNKGQNARLTIEFLHNKILQDCNNQLFLKMVETIEDFRVFLRMHPKIFKRTKSEDEQEYVSLLSEEERKELEAQTYPTVTAAMGSSLSISRQQSTLKRSDTYESNLSGHSSIHRPASLPYGAGSGGHHSLYPQTSDQPMSMIDPVLRAKSRNKEANNNNNDTASSANSRKSLDRQTTKTSSNNSLNDQSSSLRATAPPFVPKQLPAGQKQAHRETTTSKTSHQKSSSLESQNQSSKQTTAAISSNLTPVAASAAAGAHQQRQDEQHQQSSNRAPIIDPRQAIRSYLIKGNSAAANSNIYSPNKHSNGALINQQQQLQINQSSQLQSRPLSRQNSSANVDDLRARTVSIVREASNIITRIMTTADAVAFDCKGYNLGFNGQISLILFGFIPNTNLPATQGGADGILAETTKQLLNGADHQSNGSNRNANGNTNTTNQKPEVCIFDLITNPELAYCLKPLLESDQIVKVVHDVRNKSNALFVQFKIVLKNVFDTQVANLVIQQQETGKPAYMSRYISMGKLCEVYGDEALEKYRNLIRSKTRHSAAPTSSLASNNQSSKSNQQTKFKDVNYWRTRPLTDAMVYESTMDVYSLLSGVYQNLKSKIKLEYKPLCEQLNVEGVLARIKPDEIRSVKKERKIDLEVIDLKRKLYSDSTGFIVLSNREIRLLRHVEMTDEVRKKIQQCKKVAKKLERLDMKQAQQSMNSQVSSSDGIANNQQSLKRSNSSLHRTIGECSSENGGVGSGDEEQTRTTQDNSDQDKGSELATATAATMATNNADDEIGMSNLMDSSMFDELKDRMIESSSLLESLEDDDDDDHHEHHHAHPNVGNHSHQHLEHHGSSDCCRCHCHHKSPSIAGSLASKESQQGDKMQDLSSLKSSMSSTSSVGTNTEDKEKDEDTSVESRVADMAVQCDLLS